MEENAYNILDQNQYQERYTSLVERYETAKNGLDEISNKLLERNAKREIIKAFIESLEKSETLLMEFDEGLWNAIIEAVRVNPENKITFVFKDGMKLDWNI